MRLFDPLFRWPPLEAALSDQARLQSMLDFEAALARAEARAGVIPEAAARTIAAHCSADRLDGEALARRAAAAGNLAIPLVEQLTALVARDDAAAAGCVHWGATSQDAIDTGLVLQLRQALARLEPELERLAGGLAALAEKHRRTPVAGRTWLQAAVPTTFGLKAAGWLDAVNRHRARLEAARSRALVLQFGGAVGNLAALGDKGWPVAEALAEELALPLPDLPWHAHRDRLAELAAAFGLCIGTLGKIARDLSLGMQAEVGELSEPAAPGRGGSSTMPQKRNPLGSAVALAAATRAPGLVATLLSAMVQEGERGLGGWQAEWETLTELTGLLGGALHHLTDAVVGLEIDAARMRENLDAQGGLIFAEGVQTALAARLGREKARRLVRGACDRARAESRPLRDVLAGEAEVGAHLSPAEQAKLFDPESYRGSAERMIDSVLAAHAARLRSPSAKGS
jgi:3-carboxy-cis,cis-muconate cycloisomerase